MRRTGRTTRMIFHALERAERGESVTILAINKHQADWIRNQVRVWHTRYNMPENVWRRIAVTFASTFDEFERRLCQYWDNIVIDHLVLERYPRVMDYLRDRRHPQYDWWQKDSKISCKLLDRWGTDRDYDGELVCNIIDWQKEGASALPVTPQRERSHIPNVWYDPAIEQADRLARKIDQDITQSLQSAVRSYAQSRQSRQSKILLLCG